MRHIAIRMGEAWKAHADPAWLDAWRVRRVALDGGTTEIVDSGEGPALVLLPPLPGFKESFAASLPLLAPHFRIVAPDLRCVFAPGADPAARWEALVRDLEALCAALGLERVAVAGHSLGGALAQRWALAHPERVSALLLSSTFTRVAMTKGGRMARFVAQPAVLAVQRLLPRDLALAHAARLSRTWGWVYDPRCDRRVLDLVRHAIRASPPAVVSERVALALAHDTRGRLAALRMPVHLVTGERDLRFAFDAAAEIAALVPGTTRDVSPGSGHLHPLSNPAGFAEIVTRRLGGAG